MESMSREELWNQLQATIAEKDAIIAEKNATIAEKDATIAEKDAQLQAKDATIAEKDATIVQLRYELEQCILNMLSWLKERRNLSCAHQARLCGY